MCLYSRQRVTINPCFDNLHKYGSLNGIYIDKLRIFWGNKFFALHTWF